MFPIDELGLVYEERRKVPWGNRNTNPRGWPGYDGRDLSGAEAVFLELSADFEAGDAVADVELAVELPDGDGVSVAFFEDRLTEGFAELRPGRRLRLGATPSPEFVTDESVVNEWSFI